MLLAAFLLLPPVLSCAPSAGGRGTGFVDDAFVTVGSGSVTDVEGRWARTSLSEGARVRVLGEIERRGARHLHVEVLETPEPRPARIASLGTGQRGYVRFRDVAEHPATRPGVSSIEVDVRWHERADGTARVECTHEPVVRPARGLGGDLHRGKHSMAAVAVLDGDGGLIESIVSSERLWTGGSSRKRVVRSLVLDPRQRAAARYVAVVGRWEESRPLSPALLGLDYANSVGTDVTFDTIGTELNRFVREDAPTLPGLVLRSDRPSRLGEWTVWALPVERER